MTVVIYTNKPKVNRHSFNSTAVRFINNPKIVPSSRITIAESESLKFVSGDNFTFVSGDDFETVG